MGLYAIILLYLVGSSFAATLHGGEWEKKESMNDAMKNLERLLKQQEAQSSSEMYVPPALAEDEEEESSPKGNEYSSAIIEEDNGEWISYCKKFLLIFDRKTF